MSDVTCKQADNGDVLSVVVHLVQHLSLHPEHKPAIVSVQYIHLNSMIQYKYHMNRGIMDSADSPEPTVKVNN